VSILTLLILAPIIGAIAVLLGAPARRISLATAGGVLVLAIGAFALFKTGDGQFQLIGSIPLVPSWDLKFLVGADGLSLMMLLLTGLVGFAAIWVSPVGVPREKEYFACLLFIIAGAAGAFASLDLFFFYAFHELALIPTFLLIGIWGHGERQKAAWKITIYLALGSFVLLIGLIGLYQCVPIERRTFDIRTLQELAAVGGLATGTAYWVYGCLLIGFGILISLFPFHTWAPDAYAAAPAPAAMLHAGVLKKFGLYGLLRVALPLLPEAARQWSQLLLILLVGNILYVGLATIAQKRLDLTLGYSSVMHMGYIFLGIAALNPLGLTGAAVLMFAHGLSIAVLFALAGQLRERTGSLDYADLGGIGKMAPVLTFSFGLAVFASIGLPGFANFAAELMIFFGAFSSGFAVPASRIARFNGHQIATVCALWGVVISAVYMLRAYRSTFMGEPNRRWAGIGDLTVEQRLPVAVLLAALLVTGFCPQLLVNLITPGVQALAGIR
jgi:NADH-quinone oxidoreductase subunit M